MSKSNSTATDKVKAASMPDQSIMDAALFSQVNQEVSTMQHNTNAINNQSLSTNQEYLDGIEWGMNTAHSLGDITPTRVSVIQDVLIALQDPSEPLTPMNDPGPVEWRLGWVTGYLSELRALGAIL